MNNSEAADLFPQGPLEAPVHNTIKPIKVSGGKKNMFPRKRRFSLFAGKQHER